MGEVGVKQRRIVHYLQEASEAKEAMAIAHPRGREVVTAMETALAKDAEFDARQCAEGRYMRAIYPQLSPPIVIVVVFEIDWNTVQVVDLTTSFS